MNAPSLEASDSLPRVAHGSAWDWPRIERYLTGSPLPCRLACVTREGFPHVTSLWFDYARGVLSFSVQDSAWVGRWLAANLRCGFEVAVNDPPYRGVRGRGEAVVERGADDPVLPTLVDRYLGGRDSDLARWLLSRLDTEVTVRVRATWVTSWDYGARMSATDGA